jgi:hypothetical protein
MGVSPVDGDPDLGRRAAGGSTWRARGGDGDRAEGCTGEGSVWRSSARKERSVRYPRARWCSGKVKKRPGWGVGGWRRGGPHGRGKQSAVGERNSELAREESR